MDIVPENFSEFMTEHLYGKDGFYTLGKGAGRDRDYLTSPEVGDLFGYIIAHYIDEWFTSVDSDWAVVIEAGCGPGSLAASIARAGLSCADSIEYCLVDISPEHRKTAEEKLSRCNPVFDWSVNEKLPEVSVPTLVIANELFDNLPFDIGYTSDVYSSNSQQNEREPVGTGYFSFHNPDRLSGADVPADLDNFRIPLHRGIEVWVDELLQCCGDVTDLSVLIFDYIKSVTDMHDGNWLRLYNDHERIVGVDNVLRALESGVKGDITTDVTKEDIHLLFDSAGFSLIKVTPQAQWLYQQGIDSYASSLSQEKPSLYDQVAGAVNATDSSLQTESFHHEREVLLDPQGLGAFSVVTARRQI